MVCGHIRKRVISLGLNKVEGQIIHKKKMPDFVLIQLYKLHGIIPDILMRANL